MEPNKTYCYMVFVMTEFSIIPQKGICLNFYVSLVWISAWDIVTIQRIYFPFETELLIVRARIIHVPQWKKINKTQTNTLWTWQGGHKGLTLHEKQVARKPNDYGTWFSLPLLFLMICKYFKKNKNT